MDRGVFELPADFEAPLPDASQLADPHDEILLSAASSWEIAIKYALGSLPPPEAPSVDVARRMKASGSRGLPVEPVHSLRVTDLPPTMAIRSIDF